jgi:hypothetical protein
MWGRLVSHCGEYMGRVFTHHLSETISVENTYRCMVSEWGL